MSVARFFCPENLRNLDFFLVSDVSQQHHSGCLTSLYIVLGRDTNLIFKDESFRLSSTIAMPVSDDALLKQVNSTKAR